MGGFYNRKSSAGFISILENGVALGVATSIDFTGAGQTTTILGSTVTVDIPGGGSLTEETPTGTMNGVNKIFTVVNSPKLVFLNGAEQTAGGVDFTLSGAGPYTLTFVIAPVADSNLRTFY